MKAREIRPNVKWLGAVDWDRRLFDSLIPLPDGTSYNAFLIQGSERTALLDTVDPTMTDVLISQLAEVPNLDFVVAHHAEQDHSGSIPQVLAKYNGAVVVTTSKGKELLREHLNIAEGRFLVVEDGEAISLGGKTLRFIHTPWVHWPETMVTYLEEERILFSCDFFGSHLATSEIYVADQARVYEAAKRYYAEIMMPFRRIIQRNLAKVRGYEFELIAPSHGPIHNRPELILAAYKEWSSDLPKNAVVVPYISMHGSTRKMVEYLVGALAQRGITVSQFDLTATDVGKLAIALVDAATIVLGTPTVHLGPHPNMIYAASLANALRPKLRHAAVVGSYGWSTKVVEEIVGLIPNLKVEVLGAVLAKGDPAQGDYEALETLAESIAARHREAGLA